MAEKIKTVELPLEQAKNIVEKTSEFLYRKFGCYIYAHDWSAKGKMTFRVAHIGKPKDETEKKICKKCGQPLEKYVMYKCGCDVEES